MDEEERLTQRIKDLQRLQDQDRERRKPKPNIRMDEDLPDYLPRYDFWCDYCQEDFSASCYKTKHRMFGDPISVYRARCPICEEECHRLVTHRDQDLYYQKSTKVRRQRNQYAWDTLQAGDYGFKTCYGNPYAECDEKLARKEEKILQEERDKGLRGLSLEAKRRLRKLTC